MTMTETGEAPKQFGPKYPRIEGLEKFRRQARVRELTREEKHAYGDAVGEAIRKMQRAELMRCLTLTPNPFDMSGDPPPTAEERNAGQYMRPALRERRLYEHAMACKRAAS